MRGGAPDSPPVRQKMHSDFLTFIRALAQSGLEFVIVGGVAGALHGGSRLTHDIDIVPDLDSAAWRRAVDVIWTAGGRPRIPESREAIADVANVRGWIRDKGMLALSFRSPDGTVEVDLLVGESHRFAELKRDATIIDLEGVRYLVASLDDLIAMKRRAGRPQDLLDIAELESIRRRTRPG